MTEGTKIKTEDTPAGQPPVESDAPHGGVTPTRRSGSAAVPVSALLALSGAAMQGYANGTIDALFVSMFLLVSGYLAIRLAFPHGRAEHRAFLLSYGVCIFAGGVMQCYALAVFGAPQSFVDALGFYDAIFPAPPYYSWEEIRTLWIDEIEVSRGAPLAVLIWQWFYHLRYLAGLDFGPYAGVMLNALFIGWTGGLTVRTARELFGDDAWRLRRTGTLYAFCGLFVLFGALLLRDCFTTFFNALVLWGIVRWLVRPTARNLTLAGGLTAVALGAMLYLRARTMVMFGLFWLIGLGCWFFERRFNFWRAAALSGLAFALVLGSPYIMAYFNVSLGLQEQYRGVYSEHMGGEAESQSLGMRLVINQPLPVRLVLGTGALMVFPIPLWAGLQPGMGEYHLIKGYHGIYQFLVLPLVLAGFAAIGRRFLADRGASLPLVFLAAYLMANVLAVVATSMEQRHVAQFMPAFMILAALPDTRDAVDRVLVKHMAVGWFSLVILVHLAWFIATLGRS